MRTDGLNGGVAQNFERALRARTALLNFSRTKTQLFPLPLMRRYLQRVENLLRMRR